MPRETEVSEQTPERVTVTPALSEPLSNHVSEQALESNDPSVDTEPSVVTETPIYDKPKRMKKKPSYLRDYITSFVFICGSLLGVGGSLPISSADRDSLHMPLLC